jgi:hypothetical protein
MITSNCFLSFLQVTTILVQLAAAPRGVSNTRILIRSTSGGFGVVETTGCEPRSVEAEGWNITC